MIPDHFYPFWTVYDSIGQKYCDCSHEQYAITTLELHEGDGFTYKRIEAPKPLPPEIIDVKATGSYEGKLPGQQGLPSETSIYFDSIKKRLEERENDDMRNAIIDAAINGYEKVLEQSDLQKLDDLH